jgi:sporulation protein YqfC
MKLMQELRNYVLEEEFKIVYKNGKLYITNYISIPIFESNEIHIKYINGKIIVNGKNLTISKLSKDEVLITGEINKLEFRLDNE